MSFHQEEKKNLRIICQKEKKKVKNLKCSISEQLVEIGVGEKERVTIIKHLILHQLSFL